jgi:REP element-mobilizing transposase RayT
MKINDRLLRQIVSDLGLDTPFVKGRDIPVKNCWHFSTDGNAVDAIFIDEEDFINGMNRIYVLARKHNIIILAFSIMDTHVHFILWGSFEDCNRFMHDYVRATSRHIAITHGERNKLADVPIHHQVVDTDFYLKTVICYVIKNAPVGGIQFNGIDYPWSSGPLYFRRPGYWSTPAWLTESEGSKETEMGNYKKRQLLKTQYKIEGNIQVIDRLVFPGEYVAYELVERLYKTCRGFNYFMCITKEEDVDSRGGTISRLSIPMQEMRQNKNEVCRELFGVSSTKGLNTGQRLKLAKVLISRYNCSVKQVARLSGLVYNEVKHLL